MSSLVTLVAVGQKGRDEIVSYFAYLFRGRLKRDWSHAWDALVSYACDLHPAELLDDIERAYEEDLVDPGFIGFDDVQRDLAMGKDQVLARLADDPNHRLVADTVAEMGWWACFRDDKPSRMEGVTEGVEGGRPEASGSLLSGTARKGQDGQERAMSVRQRQEIQEMLRRMISRRLIP
jgi:hypothetical protein